MSVTDVALPSSLRTASYGAASRQPAPELWAPLGFLINYESVLESAHSASGTKRFLIVNSSAQIPPDEPEPQAGRMFWFRWKTLSGSYRRLMSRSRSRLDP